MPIWTNDFFQWGKIIHLELELDLAKVFSGEISRSFILCRHLSPKPRCSSFPWRQQRRLFRKRKTSPGLNPHVFLLLLLPQFLLLECWWGSVKWSSYNTVQTLFETSAKNWSILSERLWWCCDGFCTFIAAGGLLALYFVFLLKNGQILNYLPELLQCNWSLNDIVSINWPS